MRVPHPCTVKQYLGRLANKQVLTVGAWHFISLNYSFCMMAGSDCVTPSNPLGLKAGQGVDFGEGLDIWQVLQKFKSAS